MLRGVDLSVPEGAFAAVLGASGSGKTTLLRILAGFERPDRGAVTVGGAILDDADRHLPAERRRIGYVSQEGSLFPHLTVAGNVGFGLRRGRSRERVVGHLLDLVGLSALSRRYPHQLSGGQQQRVALARVLAVQPRIVLLDEPFASLDAGLRAAVRADIHALLRRSGATAVLVTHDQDEALTFADLVAVIREGRIAQVAPPRDLYETPVDPDLAQFVGEANLIEGISHGSTVETRFGPLPLRDGRLPAGQALTVLVRPEQLRVAARAGSRAGGGRGEEGGRRPGGRARLPRPRRRRPGGRGGRGGLPADRPSRRGGEPDPRGPGHAHGRRARPLLAAAARRHRGRPASCGPGSRFGRVLAVTRPEC